MQERRGYGRLGSNLVHKGGRYSLSANRFDIVLFDLDGTLIDTNHLIVTSFQHTFRTLLDREVPADQIYPYFGEPLPTTMARYAPERAQELVEHYREFNKAQHDLLVRKFPGVREMVQALVAAGVQVAVVTLKMTDMAQRGLRVCEIHGLFSLVVGSDATARHKPNPEPILFALQQLGAEPGPSVLMVGDSHLDIQCGRNAGVKTAAVGWSQQTRELVEESGPDFWAETPEALRKLVLGE